jgi:hypothetical protein
MAETELAVRISFQCACCGLMFPAKEACNLAEIMTHLDKEHTKDDLMYGIVAAASKPVVKRVEIVYE